MAFTILDSLKGVEMTMTQQRSSPALPSLAWAGVLLAWMTGAIYLLIGAGIAPDDLASPPRGVMLVAALAYFAGGWLIRRLNRRLVLAGAIANALVMVIYMISLIAGRSDLEAYAAVSKLTQVGLEVVLIALLVHLPRTAADIVSTPVTKQAG
ncbi:MAG TPA: hypothetical protein DEU95_11715 [Chloroflexi bacterium]|jgi:apolipoprotein N-acyltransferase|nr:hypothetical protein [Chloroflexota bacterium]